MNNLENEFKNLFNEKTSSDNQLKKVDNDEDLRQLIFNKAVLTHRLHQDYEKIAEFKEKHPIKDAFAMLANPNTASLINLDKIFNDLDKGGKGSGRKKSPYTKEDRQRLELPDESVTNHSKLDRQFKNDEIRAAKAEANRVKISRKKIKDNMPALKRAASSTVTHATTIEQYMSDFNGIVRGIPALKDVKLTDFTDKEIDMFFNMSLNSKPFKKGDINDFKDRFAVGLLFNDEGKIVLLRRSWSAPWGDLQYSLPGGKIEESEEPVDCLVREIHEEMLVDLTSQNCTLILRAEESTELGKFEINYFSINTSDFKEEDIVLNFENDKYVLVDPYTELETISLIPNLKVALDYIFNTREDNVETVKINKAFDDLFQVENPFEKGLDTAKLHLKQITDKLGRRVNKWVRGEEPQKADKKSKETEEEGEDLHSKYQDDEMVKKFAKNSPKENLLAFIEEHKNNKNAARLVKIAKQELSSRGIKTDDEPETPFKSKKKEEVKSKEQDGSKQSVESDEEYNKRVSKENQPNLKNKDLQDHFDLIRGSDNVDDLKNHYSHIDKDKKLSDEDKKKIKSEIKEHLSNLVLEGKDVKTDIKDSNEADPKDLEEEGDKGKESKENNVKDGIYSVHEKDFNTNDYLKDSGVALDEESMTPEMQKKAKWEVDPDTGTKYDMNSGAGIQKMISSKFEKMPAYKKMKQIQEDMNKTYSKIISDPNFRFAFVGGAPGLGKTFGIKKLAKEENIKRAKLREKNGTTEPKDMKVHIPSTLTKAGLIDMLYKKNGSENVIVIDDKDDIWQDPDLINIIKTATNTNGADRVIQAGSKVTAGNEKQAKQIKQELEKEGIDIDNVSPEQATDEVREKIAEYKKLMNLPIKFNGKIVILSNDRMPTDSDDEKASKKAAGLAHHYAALKDRGSVDFYELNNEQRKMMVAERAMQFVPGAEIDDITGKMNVPVISGNVKAKTAKYLADNIDKIKQEVGPRELYKIYSELQSESNKGKKPEAVLDSYFKLNKVQKGLSNELIQYFENLILENNY